MMRDNSYVEAIFAGKFQPGEPVLEMHLARSLRVSQATVCETLVLLERIASKLSKR
jgi:DNA-binding GntR family transcriptional regulator